MLTRILDRLEEATLAEIGLTLHGLHVEPGEGRARVILQGRPSPFEAGVLDLDSGQLRQVGDLLRAVADECDTTERAGAEAPGV